LKRGADSRTLSSEEQLFSIDLNEAVEIYKQPKVRRRGVAKPPLKELGVDPETKRPIIIKDGRFGMYVTDGETNATLRRGDTVEAMTIERAQELLAGRRAWELENGGAPKKKSSRKKKTAPTLTEKTIKDAGSKRKAKKSATGKSKKSK
jgi:DNA topoisomerase-1